MWGIFYQKCSGLSGEFFIDPEGRNFFPSWRRSWDNCSTSSEVNEYIYELWVNYKLLKYVLFQVINYIEMKMKNNF